MTRSCRWFPIALAMTCAVGPLRAEDEAQAARDEDTLKQAALAADAPTLLRYFRERTLTEEQRQEIIGLVAKLGDDSYEERERASAALRPKAARAAPLLRRAITAREAELEVIRRVEALLEPLKGPEGGTTAAAARLLALRKPPEAAAVLLAFIPFVEDEWLADEIRKSLATLALREGRPEPGLLEGLRSPSVVTRGAAAGALARAGQLDRVRHLLKDPDPTVRLWTALGSAANKEKAAVPVLIALLAEPSDEIWRVEDALYRLAGADAPAIVRGTTPESRAKCRDAWAAWWEKHGERVDLAVLNAAPTQLGFNLFIKIDVGKRTGQVAETDRAGNLRWKITGLSFPVDAQILPGDRVLVTEYDIGRITERDFTGKVLWEKANIPHAINARRLPNGNTYVATLTEVLEFDQAGRETMKVNRGGMNATGRLPDGRIVCVTSEGRCSILDAKGAEIKAFNVNPTSSWTSGIDVLASGRIIVPDMAGGKVVEFDLEGKKIAEVKGPAGVTSATQLDNGNLLVATEKGQAFEIDRAGKVISEFKDDDRVWRVRRR